MLLRIMSIRTDKFYTDETLTTVSVFRELSPHSLTSDLMDNAGF